MNSHCFRAIAPLSLFLSLSACWTSEKPLMPVKDMDIVTLGKVYWSVETSAAMKPDRYTLTVRGKAFEARTTTPGKPVSPADTLAFDKLQGSLYLTQITSAEGKVRGYRIFDLGRKDEVRAFDPTCGADEKADSRISVTDNDCKFSDYATLKQRAMARAAGMASGQGVNASLAKSYKLEGQK